MKKTCDVVVIGAGIIGSACAYYLSRSGFEVCLIERHFPVSGTARASDGLILLWDKAPGIELQIGLESRRAWSELENELEGQFRLEHSGTLLLAEQPAQIDEAWDSTRELRAAGQRAQRLNAAELRSLEPALADNLPGGIIFADDLQVDPRQAAQALLSGALAQGAQLISGQPVIGLELGAAGAGATVITPDGRIHAAHVVCAAGAWSAEIAALLGWELGVQPRKGQILVSAPVPGLIHHPLLEGRYATTVHTGGEGTQVAHVAEMTPSGRLLLGSSRQFAGFDRQVSLEVNAAIAARARRFIPSLAAVPIIRSYAGLRPWSADQRPLIGPSYQLPGLHFACGHEGAGICLAPISGKLISGWISGTPLAGSEALLPDRLLRPAAAGLLAEAPQAEEHAT